MIESNSTRNSFAPYASERVENFAIHCLKKLFRRNGFVEPSDIDAKTIVNSCGFDTIVKKYKEYSTLKHVCKYGDLEKRVQQQLNLKLTIYDILGKNNSEKKILVQKIIQEHEEFIGKKKKIGLEENQIINIVSEHEVNNNRLKKFIRKADVLFAIQKNKLRRSIIDDEFYNQSINKLTEIYSKHIERMFSTLSKSDEA